MSAYNVITTSYGELRISAISEAWLDSKAPAWRRVYEPQSKDAAAIFARRKAVKVLELYISAAEVVAEIARHAEIDLKEF